MATDDDSDDAEKTITSESNQYGEESESSNLSEYDKIIIATYKEASHAHQSSKFSKATVQLGFRTLQVFFGVIGLILVAISATTGFSFISTVGVMSLIIGLLEVSLKWIEVLDKKI
ncbi:hypothetical protein [Haloarcula sp. CGMCC 1.6347]|uniref:hypothetical protein n=1 Tax=Haloarcula sp. CGMCC 1.6347 TaxID=3111455 RepID=UPI00300EC88C